MPIYQKIKYRVLKKVTTTPTIDIKTYIKQTKVSLVPDPGYDVPFYVEDVSGNGSTITLYTNRADLQNIEYSLDATNWTSTKPNVPANGKVYIRAIGTHINNAEGRSNAFINCSDYFNIGGNIMSLFYGSSFTGVETTMPSTSSFALASFCQGSTTLKSAQELLLPATTVYKGFLKFAFYGCINLEHAPRLFPALHIDETAYSETFQNCSSLVDTPEIVTTEAPRAAYQFMFSGCSSLVTAPSKLSVDTNFESHRYMFQNCTSLVKAPKIMGAPAGNNCYQSLFNGCSLLNEITVDSSVASWNTSYCGNWVNSVASTGTFTKPASLTIPTGGNGIPSGWTVVNV